ncbi:unnamed protein product [Peronospora belbahrii]|uniref:Uncharacterized protein n=1 Tax=Peronospora belbahrii TaxID=622444 RepID=A0AAU9KHA1_9STRA|nr:unnamed protein product [Peronospora belbahrii]CAH0515165.1 unnamed protein product [Peronospora belbahrii]
MDANSGTLMGDMHTNGGDIDSLLSTEKEVRKEPLRRLHEPYDRHRAHDLRAECYRRGLRPIKKGPNANDNKSGYIDLLRKNDVSISKPPKSTQISKQEDDETEDEEDASNGGDNVNEVEIITNMTNKRKRPTMAMQTQTETNHLAVTSAAVADLQGFYEGGAQAVLPMQYSPNVPKPLANPTTDLEILSGIANSYTQNVAADGQLCGNCRTVVTDQLMESIRLGKTKMQLQEWHKLTEQRDRDTFHLKQVLDILQDLRKSFREAQVHGMNHDLLVELQDDMAFFQNLKEQTKEKMRQAMREARERAANKSNAMA